MKRHILLLTILILSLAACTPPAGAGQSIPPPQTVTASPEPSPSSAPMATPETTPISLPANIEYKELSDNTVIIADRVGCIYGGYSGGKWLSHSEAAAYCGNSLTFYAYNLAGFVESAESSGVTYDESGYNKSSNADGSGDDEDVYYSLDTSIDYEESSPPAYLYNIPPKRMPEITVISDTSALLPTIQQLVDEQLSKGAAAVQIGIAVSADIDNDGEQETVVNADNCADKIYEFGGENYYSIACIIESDGSVRVIQDEYVAKNRTEDYSYVVYTYVQNIIDLNGDGRCEIVAAWEEWEADGVTVYTYDGQSLADVLSYFTWV